MTESADRELQIVTKLCNVINESNLSTDECLNVITQFLFAIGAALDGCKPGIDSAEVLKHYYKKPTLGNALMTQALWMRDTWMRGLDVGDSTGNT